MAPIATTTIIMSSPATTITEIPLSSLIFVQSFMTFVNDPFAYTTVDLNLSKIRSITTWCKQKSPFIVNLVA
jgi:hypothetical protein